MRRVCLVLVLLTTVLLTSGAPPASAAGDCVGIRLGGQGYVLERFDVGCRFSRTWGRRLYRSKGERAPAGFRCKSFTDWRESGQCLKRGNPRIGFSWRPGD